MEETTLQHKRHGLAVTSAKVYWLTQPVPLKRMFNEGKLCMRVRQRTMQSLTACVSWAFFDKDELKIDRGVNYNLDPNAPKITVVSPAENISVSGTTYTLQVKVAAKNPLKEVYVDTQIGNFPLTRTGSLWTLTVDTTKVPNGTKVGFTVIAVDVKKKTGSSEPLNVVVQN